MTRPHNPQLLRNALFNRCKKLWGFGLTAKFLIFVAGAIVVLYPKDEGLAGIATMVLVLISEGLLWWSDRWKDAAQELHRKLDFENAFGWEITRGEFADLLARYPGKLENLAGEPKGTYFASQGQPGVRRALQNVRESSWWSMHLAESMFWVFMISIALILVGCVLLLDASVENFHGALSLASASIAANSPPVIDVVSGSVIRIVTSSLLFIVTYGLARFAVDYWCFSSKSEKIKERAESLLNANAADEIAAIKLWQEYHLARASAPLMPTWIWRLREKKLNTLYTAYLAEVD